MGEIYCKSSVKRIAERISRRKVVLCQEKVQVKSKLFLQHSLFIQQSGVRIGYVSNHKNRIKAGTRQYQEKRC